MEVGYVHMSTLVMLLWKCTHHLSSLLILKPYMALLFRHKQSGKKDAVLELAAINAMTDEGRDSKEKQDTVENVCYEKIQSKSISTEMWPFM